MTTLVTEKIADAVHAAGSFSAITGGGFVAAHTLLSLGLLVVWPAIGV